MNPRLYIILGQEACHVKYHCLDKTIFLIKMSPHLVACHSVIAKPDIGGCLSYSDRWAPSSSGDRREDLTTR